MDPMDETAHPSASEDVASVASARAQSCKRKRISIACRACRMRKSRCDGGQPCSTCQGLDGVCIYDQPAHIPAATVEKSTEVIDLQKKNHLLEQRLLAIEQRLQAFEDRREDMAPAQRQTGDSITAGSTPSLDGISVGTARPRTHFESQDDVVDGMGSVPLRDVKDEDEYFGGSSNVAFLRFVVRALGRSVAVVERPTPPVSDPPRESFDEDAFAFFRRPVSVEAVGEQLRSKKTADPYALPPPDEAEHLLRLYFITVNLMLPCIHEDSFRTMYRRAATDSSRAVSRQWLGLLNMVFAIANNVQTPTSPSIERATLSDLFFERAMELVRPSMLGRVSLELLQVFLLMEIYLEGTASSSLASTFHSLAVKGCYQLGLHFMDSSNHSHLDREIRRRLWYLCIMNDRWLSFTHGRPPLIPLSLVRIESTSYFAFSNVPRGSTTLSLAYFDATMSITHIVGETVERLYDQNLGPRPAPITNTILDQIARLCWKLAQWQDSLHPSLRIIASGDALEDMSSSLEATRLRILLSLRYLGTRILVLRPILVYFLDRPATTDETEHQARWLCKSGAILLADFARTCGDVLHIIKNILAASQHNDQNLLGAWWFSTYYTFNASLAVLGILLVKRMPSFSADLAAISVPELRSFLGLAMEILHGLNNGNKTITRCRNTLERLLAQLDADNIPAVDGAGFGEATSFSFSPSSVWSWQLMDPVLFGSELSFGIGSGIGNYDPNVAQAFVTNMESA